MVQIIDDVLCENEKYLKYLVAFDWNRSGKKCHAKMYIDENLTEMIKVEKNHHKYLSPQSFENKKFFS